MLFLLLLLKKDHFQLAIVYYKIDTQILFFCLQLIFGKEQKLFLSPPICKICNHHTNRQQMQISIFLNGTCPEDEVEEGETVEGDTNK